MQPVRHVCVHGHFYQPPRENPFTGVVEDQISARPFANWNERIVAESYKPNLAARVLDANGDDLEQVNNYTFISHDFGPTLLAWMEENHPEVYRGIIDSDRQSMGIFDGHGSAMAQSYNHTILPLSTREDKETQIAWGIADFRSRYERHPEGMWLPETAVDNETLEILVDNGILFTVLSPYQAALAEQDPGSLVDVTGGRIDPRFPYWVEPAPGKSIAVFFYDGPVSQEIAFNGLLEDGRRLADRLIQTLGPEEDSPMLGHVATDGETYGHHHRFGEMALASAIRSIQANPEVSLANYGSFLAAHPPSRRAVIREDSSWSCAHGVERWRSDCGCSTGGEPGWHQRWREPLRRSLDWLKGVLTTDFDESGAALLTDPRNARNAYIEVLLGRDSDSFLDEHCVPRLAEDERKKALGYLEIQRRSMLMYTSCGWFFNDLEGLETVFVLRHAGRAIDLAREVLGRDFEPEFLSLLEEATSNRGRTGRDVYYREVTPFMGRRTTSA